MRASTLPIFGAVFLSGCAFQCTGPGCVDQLGWFSKCYGHRSGAELITTSRFTDDGKASIVLVNTTYEQIDLSRKSSSIGYDQGWTYAEQRMREDGRCDAGF